MYIIIAVITICAGIAVWVVKGWTSERLGGHAKSLKEDILPMLLSIVFMATMVFAFYFGIKELFLSKDSNEYFWTVENDLPLIIFQTVFLSMLTNVLLPLFFKVYGSVMFGTYRSRIEKGFDQGIYKRDEKRMLMQNTNVNCRTFYEKKNFLFLDI